MRLRLTRDRWVLAFTWLRMAFAALIMGCALAYGLPVIVAGLAGLPAAIARGDLASGLGVTLMVTMWAALFSVGAGLWVRSRSARPRIVAAWQRTFTLTCGVAVALMLIILAVSIVPRL